MVNIGKNKTRCGKTNGKWGKWLSYVAIFVFVCLSCLLVIPQQNHQQNQYQSFQLNKRTVQYENAEKTDYVDDHGAVTIAEDLGYATVVISKVNDGLLEAFYDDLGRSVSDSSGCYARFREFDQDENNIRTICLGGKGEVIISKNGYAIEEKIYNGKKQAIGVRYYNAEGIPICTPLYGYGNNNEYDEDGNVQRIEYIDEFGKPMITGQGYAAIIRNYYPKDQNKGKLESEFYFDEKGEPVSLSLGQFGVHIEYNENGNVFARTYLNEKGEATATKRGYTTIHYNRINGFVVEQYFDEDGNPFRLPEGQYGVRRGNEQLVLLDQNGNEMFNLRTILYNQTYLPIIIAIFLVFLTAILSKRTNILLSIIYLLVIIYLTMAFRDGVGIQKNVNVFYSYKRFFSNYEARAGTIRNIWLFIPLGAFIYRIFPKKKAMFFPIALSVLIEGIQYFAGIGYCELDDVMSNGLGGIIGYGMGYLAKMIQEKIQHKQVNYPE